MITGFESLKVWHLAHALALKVYLLSRQFPRDERFGITAQLHRAALAIPTNIAEGSARQYSREFLQFCSIARGSIAETQYLLRFILDLKLINVNEYTDLRQEYEQVGKMVNSLMTYLRGNSKRKSPRHG